MNYAFVVKPEAQNRYTPIYKLTIEFCEGYSDVSCLKYSPGEIVVEKAGNFQGVMLNDLWESERKDSYKWPYRWKIFGVYTTEANMEKNRKRLANLFARHIRKEIKAFTKLREADIAKITLTKRKAS